jgi:two-component system, cell cycle response regulator
MHDDVEFISENGAPPAAVLQSTAVRESQMPLEQSPSGETEMEPLHDTTIVQQLVPQWQCRVLVVDDDEIVRAQLTKLLEAARYDVQVAACGEEALQILDTSQCQIVLTDWQMPGMDGLALCRKVRLEHDEGYVYVMMLTVRQGKQDMLLSMAAGADDYIVKGSSSEEILARMEVARRITHLEFSLRLSNRVNRRLSVTDPLTTANNRRYLMKYLPRELARAQRYNRPLSILSCDIDAFKQINDRLGHAAGDQVLQEFVRRATGCIRETSDWLARSGGDEFTIVMPETDTMGANCVARKLREVLIDPSLTVQGQTLKVTVSIGVTSLQTRTELANTTAVELLRSADQGLYRSKQSGKDQITATSAFCT